jgi:hypothetical protein
MLPPSHRLQGGAILSVLRWKRPTRATVAPVPDNSPEPVAPSRESSSCAPSRRYRGPMARRNSARHVVRESSRRSCFGGGFPQMRRAMVHSLAAFVEEGKRVSPACTVVTGDGPRLLSCMRPAQCTIVGTSALRLRQCQWAGFHCGGPERYFKQAQLRDAASRRVIPLRRYHPDGDSRQLRHLVPHRFPTAITSRLHLLKAETDRLQTRFRAATASMGALGHAPGFARHNRGRVVRAAQCRPEAVWSDGACGRTPCSWITSHQHHRQPDFATFIANGPSGMPQGLGPLSSGRRARRAAVGRYCRGARRHLSRRKRASTRKAGPA